MWPNRRIYPLDWQPRSMRMCARVGLYDVSVGHCRCKSFAELITIHRCICSPKSIFVKLDIVRRWTVSTRPLQVSNCLHTFCTLRSSKNTQMCLRKRIIAVPEIDSSLVKSLRAKNAIFSTLHAQVYPSHTAHKYIIPQYYFNGYRSGTV